MKSTFSPAIALVIEFSIMGKGPFKAVIGHRVNLSRRINSLFRNLAASRKPYDRTALKKFHTVSPEAQLNIPRTAYELCHLGPCDVTSISSTATVTARDLHKTMISVIKHNNEVADSIENFATWHHELINRKAQSLPVVWEKDYTIPGDQNSTQETLVTVDMGPVLGHQTTVMVLGGRDLRVSSMTNETKKTISNMAYTRIIHNAIGFLVNEHYRKLANRGNMLERPVKCSIVKAQESKKFIAKAIELLGDAGEHQKLVSFVAVGVNARQAPGSFPRSATISKAESDSLSTIITAVRTALYGSQDK